MAAVAYYNPQLILVGFPVNLKVFAGHRFLHQEIILMLLGLCDFENNIITVACDCCYTITVLSD